MNLIQDLESFVSEEIRNTTFLFEGFVLDCRPHDMAGPPGTHTK